MYEKYTLKRAFLRLHSFAAESRTDNKSREQLLKKSEIEPNANYGNILFFQFSKFRKVKYH